MDFQVFFLKLGQSVKKSAAPESLQVWETDGKIPGKLLQQDCLSAGVGWIFLGFSVDFRKHFVSKYFRSL
jgi:hypothetical protein